MVVQTEAEMCMCDFKLSIWAEMSRSTCGFMALLHKAYKQLQLTSAQSGLWLLSWKKGLKKSKLSNLHEQIEVKICMMLNWNRPLEKIFMKKRENILVHLEEMSLAV